MKFTGKRILTMIKDCLFSDRERFIMPLDKETEIKFVYIGSIDNSIPQVVNVKTINDKVVIVYFADGTKAKAVCDKDDTFSLEQGIGICIAKRLMSKDESRGTSKYNKAIKDALKVMKRNEELRKAKEEIIAEEKRIEEKIKRKKQKRVEKRRQKRVQEIADAILVAVDTSENI
jgi:hypothetical protein